MPSYPVKTGRVRKYYDLPKELVERVHRWRRITPHIETEVAAVRRLLDEALAVYEERGDIQVMK